MRLLVCWPPGALSVTASWLLAALSCLLLCLQFMDLPTPASDSYRTLPSGPYTLRPLVPSSWPSLPFPLWLPFLSLSALHGLVQSASHVQSLAFLPCSGLLQGPLAVLSPSAVDTSPSAPLEMSCPHVIHKALVGTERYG